MHPIVSGHVDKSPGRMLVLDPCTIGACCSPAADYLPAGSNGDAKDKSTIPLLGSSLILNGNPPRGSWGSRRFHKHPSRTPAEPVGKHFADYAKLGPISAACTRLLQLRLWLSLQLHLGGGSSTKGPWQASLSAFSTRCADFIQIFQQHTFLLENTIPTLVAVRK